MVLYHRKQRMSVARINADGTISGQDGSISGSSRTGAGIYRITRSGSLAWPNARTAFLVQPEGASPRLLHEVVRVSDAIVEVRFTDAAGGYATDVIWNFMCVFMD
mgnify:CR=1 FL=1